MWVKEAPFHNPRIVASESDPPAFELVLEREMPTPGWTFTVDRVETDAAGGRIIAEVTEKRPGGIVAQVLTPAELRIDLGSPPRGVYFLELRIRRSNGPYVAVQAFLLNGY